MTTAGKLDRRDAIDGFAAATMVLLTMSWGLNQVLIKVSNVGYNPVFQTVGRSALATVLVFRWGHGRGIRLFERDGTLWAGMLAGAMFAAEFVLIFFGLDYTSAARGPPMVDAMPLWGVIGAPVWVGVRD